MRQRRPARGAADAPRRDGKRGSQDGVGQTDMQECFHEALPEWGLVPKLRRARPFFLTLRRLVFRFAASPLRVDERLQLIELAGCQRLRAHQVHHQRR